MRMQPRRLPLAGACCALATAATLALPACTDTGYARGSANISTSSYYRMGGRYYHCHSGGVCHNVHHPNYYWSGGYYRPRPSYRYHHHRPVKPPPPRPRPL